MNNRLTSALCATLFLMPIAAVAAEPIGSIISLEGKATITRDKAEFPASKNSAIKPQDIITTDKDGIAEIRFSDASVFTVGTNSTFTIDQFIYNAESPADNQSALRVGSGFFHFVSGKLAREKVRIDTPVSTIGIRGTELAGEVKKDGKTLVSLVECCVDVRSLQGATSLSRIGTFTEVKSQRSAPTPPALTPDWWAEEATNALGKDRETLGLAEIDETDGSYDLGPNNRKSFPFIK